MNSSKSDLLKAIGEKMVLDEDLTKQLQAALKEFKERFVAQARETAA